MAKSIRTETKASCALALTTRLLITMVKRGLISIDDAARIAHDAGDVAEQMVEGGDEGRMLMDGLIAAINNLRQAT
jgi:hypothetical protein